MKVINITLLFLILCFSATAKDSTTVEFKRFAFGIHASPDYCSSNNRSPIIAYSFGEDISFYINKKFAVSLGINFSQKGYSVQLNTYNSFGSQYAYSIRHNFNYLEIPLKANFLFGEKKVQLLMSAGLTSAFLLFEQPVYLGSGSAYSRSAPNYNFTPFNLFVNGGLGANFILGKKVSLRVIPTFNYGMIATSGIPAPERLWSAGLNVGCHIRF